MRNAIHTDARSTATKATSAPETSSLSAVVSRKLPRVEALAQRRARNPSKKSVTAAIAKSTAAIAYAYRTRWPAMTSAMMTGTRATRRYVIAVRKFEARRSASLTVAPAS
jgi:hypothetical protein